MTLTAAPDGSHKHKLLLSPVGASIVLLFNDADRLTVGDIADAHGAGWVVVKAERGGV